MLARFKVPFLLPGDSDVWAVSSFTSTAAKRLPESALALRPNLLFVEVPFARSALLGGDGDRELEFQERLA